MSCTYGEYQIFKSYERQLRCRVHMAYCISGILVLIKQSDGVAQRVCLGNDSPQNHTSVAGFHFIIIEILSQTPCEGECLHCPSMLWGQKNDDQMLDGLGSSGCQVENRQKSRAEALITCLSPLFESLSGVLARPESSSPMGCD